MSSRTTPLRCDFEFDGHDGPVQCEAPYRFKVSRADGDQSFSGGTDHGVEYACAAHLPAALWGMASGDEVHLIVELRYDKEGSFFDDE